MSNCRVHYKEQVEKKVHEAFGVGRTSARVLPTGSILLPVNPEKSNLKDKSNLIKWAERVVESLNTRFRTDLMGNMLTIDGERYPKAVIIKVAVPSKLIDYYIDKSVNKTKERLQNIPTKPGVKELFESNPELANAVYEALGYMRVYRTGEYNPDDKTFFVSPSKGTWDKYFKGEVQELFTKKLYLPLTNKTFTSFKELRDKYDRGEFTDKDVANIYPEESGIQNFEQYEISPQDIVSADVVKQQAQQQYSQYLDTIFPDSKVKDIVYHGTDKKNIEFIKNNINGYFAKNKRGTPNAIFFSKDKAPKGSVYDRKFNVSVILNLKNSFIRNDKGSRDSYSEDYKTTINNAEQNKYDGVQILNTNDNFDTDIFVVFDPEQIHILGDKQDIEGFIRYVNKNTKSIKKSTENISLNKQKTLSLEKQPEEIVYKHWDEIKTLLDDDKLSLEDFNNFIEHLKNCK